MQFIIGYMYASALKMVRYAYESVAPCDVSGSLRHALNFLDRHHLLGGFVRYVARFLPDALGWLQAAIACL